MSKVAVEAGGMLYNMNALLCSIGVVNVTCRPIVLLMAFVGICDWCVDNCLVNFLLHDDIFLLALYGLNWSAEENSTWPMFIWASFGESSAEICSKITCGWQSWSEITGSYICMGNHHFTSTLSQSHVFFEHVTADDTPRNAHINIGNFQFHSANQFEAYSARRYKHHYTEESFPGNDPLTSHSFIINTAFVHW